MIKNRKLALKHLSVTNVIEIGTKPFSKNLFFDVDNPTRCDSLRSWPTGCAPDSWIFEEIPNTAPAFRGFILKTFKKTRFECMYDSEIMDELGGPKLFTIKEFFAIISYLLHKQFKGQDGILLNDGSDNVFYFRSKNRAIAAHLRWFPEGRDWGFGVGELATKSSNGYRPCDKCAVFSRC